MSRLPAGAAVVPEAASGVPASDVGVAVVPGAAELIGAPVVPAGVVAMAGAPVLTPGTGAPAGMPAPGISSHRLLTEQAKGVLPDQQPAEHSTGPK